MHTNKKSSDLKSIARRSRLIRVISKLYHLTEPDEIRDVQKRLDRMNMRHSVLCRAGRLELIADLISEKKGCLKRSERKALDLLSKELENEKRDDHTILDFSTDYLLSTLEKNTAMPPLLPPDLLNRKCAGKTVAAISLTGLVMTGCAQQKDTVQTAPLKGEKDSLVYQQNSDFPQKEQQNAVSESADSALESAMQRSRFFTYSVKPGDSLKKIALKTGIALTEIAQFNNIRYDKKRNWYVLHPGQKLILSKDSLPEKTEPEKPDKTKSVYLSLEKKQDPGPGLIHFVVKGDSLWKLSRKYDVPLEQIAKANHIKDPGKIRYGNILRIPGKAAAEKNRPVFNKMSKSEKIEFIKNRTIEEGHQYVGTIVEIAEEYEIDPRLYASLIWEESWFDSNARSKDNCRKLAQLDPRFHEVSQDIKNNFRKSLGYLRHEFVYYRKKGFDKKASAICALAAYNGGDTRIRRLIRTGEWDGKKVETIPIPETREHLKKILRRCEKNYQAVL